MKLGVVAAPPPRPRPLLEPAVQATLNRQITAARRERLGALRPYPADFRRALRAVLGAPS